MINELTEDQVQLMYTVRDNWISKLRNSVYDKDKVERNIKTFYDMCKLGSNVEVVHLKSPLALQYYFNIIGNTDLVRNQVENQVWNQVMNQVENQVGNQVENQVWNQVMNQVENQVGNQVMNQVRNQVGNQVRNQVVNQVGNQVMNQVENQVGNQVWNQVENQVMNQVENQVGNQVEDQVRNQVGNQVWNQVGNQVEDQVRNQVGNQVWNQVEDQKMKYFSTCNYGDIFDYGWVSFYDYMQQIGVKYDKKLEQLFNKFKEIISSGHYTMIMSKNICAACPLPKVLNKDTQGRLHSLTDYAIEWEDGYKLAFIEGRYIDYELFEKFRSGNLSAKEVVKIKNMEQKYVMLKHLGAEKILKDLNATKIDHSDRGNELYTLKVDDVDVKMLKYSCPSTGRVYTKFVHSDITKADHAQAWSFSLSNEEYGMLKHES